eukprot:maker-scaffold_18-snap-gene-2.66-mRNA-1 protein AED:0.01 eAED:0.01 QI:123/1/1/1/1/1/3/107/565
MMDSRVFLLLLALAVTTQAQTEESADTPLVGGLGIEGCELCCRAADNLVNNLDLDFCLDSCNRDPDVAGGSIECQDIDGLGIGDENVLNDARRGCEMGRDFRFQGLTALLEDDNNFDNNIVMTRCAPGSDVSSTQLITRENRLVSEEIGDTIASQSTCQSCCNSLNSQIDEGPPDDFSTDACEDACGVSDERDCFNMDNINDHRVRFGCLVSIDFTYFAQTKVEEGTFSCVNGEVVEIDEDETNSPSFEPTFEPIGDPTFNPTVSPTLSPSVTPTLTPSFEPTFEPIGDPTFNPTVSPTLSPSFRPTKSPSFEPTFEPIGDPTFNPTESPTLSPSFRPTKSPSFEPNLEPTFNPTVFPTLSPSFRPTDAPTFEGFIAPTRSPSKDAAATEPPTRDDEGNNDTFSEELWFLLAITLFLFTCLVACFSLLVLARIRHKRRISSILDKGLLDETEINPGIRSRPSTTLTYQMVSSNHSNPSGSGGGSQSPSRRVGRGSKVKFARSSPMPPGLGHTLPDRKGSVESRPVSFLLQDSMQHEQLDILSAPPKNRAIRTRPHAPDPADSSFF